MEDLERWVRGRCVNAAGQESREVMNGWGLSSPCPSFTRVLLSRRRAGIALGRESLRSDPARTVAKDAGQLDGICVGAHVERHGICTCKVRAEAGPLAFYNIKMSDRERHGCDRPPRPPMPSRHVDAARQVPIILIIPGCEFAALQTEQRGQDVQCRIPHTPCCPLSVFRTTCSTL